LQTDEQDHRSRTYMKPRDVATVNWAILSVVFALFATAGILVGESRIDYALVIAAHRALPKEISSNEVV